jgi:hypothetical protein
VGRLAESHKRRIVPTKATLVAFAGAALCFVANMAHANVFEKDRREQRDPTQPLLRSVGLLHHAEAGAGGTAFLVSNCHIATAYHVAFITGRDSRTGQVELGSPRIGHTADFLIGPDPQVASRFAARARATVVAFGRFSKSDFQGMAGDWAILKLDTCLGSRYGFLRYARPGQDSPMPSGALMTIGFPSSRAAQPGITVERGCKAMDHGPVAGLVGIDCAFENGMSGGPVLERQTDGRWLVVGLVQQSMAPVDGLLPKYSMEHRNQMVYITAFQQALDGALRADGRKLLARRAK